MEENQTLVPDLTVKPDVIEEEPNRITESSNEDDNEMKQLNSKGEGKQLIIEDFDSILTEVDCSTKGEPSIDNSFEELIESTEEFTEDQTSSEQIDSPRSVRHDLKLKRVLQEIEAIEHRITENASDSKEIEIAEQRRAALFFAKASNKVIQWKLCHQSDSEIAKQYNCKEILLDACIHFQMAYELGKMFDVKLLVEWGDAITLLSKKYKIPPLLEQAAEKYSRACTIEPNSIVSLIKWGSALSRCAVSRFELDFEYNEELFTLADSKFAEAEEIFGNTWSDQDSPSSDSNSSTLISPSRLHSQSSVTTIRKSKTGVKVKLIKSNTPRTRLSASVDRGTGVDHNTIEFQLLIGWGRSLQRHVSVLENQGEFQEAMNKSLHAAKLFNRALLLKPGNASALRLWGKVVDFMGMLKIMEYRSEELEEAVKDYIGTFTHTANQFKAPSLKPLIALVLSHNPAVQKADPLNSLRQIAKNCHGELQREAKTALSSLELLLVDAQIGDQSFAETKIVCIEDSELGFAHMPPSAKKILEASAMTYEEIRDNTPLIVSLLLFLTHKKEWPQALLTSTSFRHQSGTISALPQVQFIHEDPRRTFRNRIVIGSGTFSEVFTARMKGSKTNNVAIKVFNKPYSAAKRVIDLEIQLIKWLNHPNLVQYVSCYLWNDIVWVIMDYCDGGSLRQLIREQIFLKENQIAYLTREVIRGVSYLHSQHICHRDLKSGNILLHLNGKVQIGDLGLSIQIHGADAAPLPMAGSCYWMAPEVVLGRPYGFKADVWAIGCIVMEMTNGYIPRGNCTHLRAMLLNSTVGHHGIDEPQKFSPALRDFVTQCCQLNPRARPAVDKLLEHPFLQLACDADGMIGPLEAAFVSNTLINSGLL